MIEHAKILLAARIFVERFGQEALKEASRRATELRNAGNTDGWATWEMMHQEVKNLVDGDINGSSK